MLLLTCYTPRLLHWWFTQKLFPSATVLEGNPTFFCEKDLDVLKNTPGYQLFTQDGDKETKGYEDGCCAGSITKIRLTKTPLDSHQGSSDGGHHLLVYDTVCEAVLKSLLLEKILLVQAYH
ncbi:hypothetical protein HAX54_012471 [Datura stramonium]|uniref:Uncharacterized protein n=1 Tax=Datura stramonium TaxID=4076 RepID=A0ABS8TJV1_DATST|nr:hypothetical protein [Datura stramonium]